MAYLRSYLPPHETPITKWTSKDHRTFVSALRLVQCVPEAHRFGALSLLLPGRTATDVKRYFNRAGRAGLIRADGRIRRKVICKAREGETVGYPVFLRRCLSKFVRGVFLQVDDGALKLPSPALHNSSVKIGSVDLVRTDKTEGDRAVSLAFDLSSQDAICKKPKEKMEEYLSDKKTNGVTEMHIVKDQKRGTRRKLQSGRRAGENRKLGILKGGVSGNKLVAARRRLVERVRIIGEAGDGGATKAILKDKAAIKNVQKIPLKLRLRIKNLETNAGKDREVAYALGNKASIPPRGSLRSSDAQPALLRSNSRKRTDDGHANDRDVSHADTLITSLCKTEKRVRFVDDLQTHQAVSSPVKRAKCAYLAGDQSLCGLRQGQCVNVSEKVRVRSDCKSATSIENELLITRRMPTSRRLYCPPNPAGPERSIATGSENIGSSVSRPMSASDRSFNADASVPLALSEIIQVPKASRSCSAGHEVVGGRCTASDQKNQRCEELSQPLEPFREDMVISLIDSDGSLSNESDERLSLGSLSDTAVSGDSTGLSSESSTKSLRQRQPDPVTVISANKRLSVDFLLCNSDEVVHTKSREQQRSKLSSASVDTAAAGVDASLTRYSYCCGRCKSQRRNNEETQVFQVVIDNAIQPTYSWSLPKTGTAWTKAWAARHWSACLSSDMLRIAEAKFHNITEEARCLMRTMEIFTSMSDDDGVRLGHRQERARLLMEFEPHYYSVTEGESIGLFELSSNEHFAPPRPMPSTSFAEGEHAYALDFLANEKDMQYEDIIDGLVRRWRDVRVRFVRRLEEMENRQAREIEGYKNISAVMQL